MTDIALSKNEIFELKKLIKNITALSKKLEYTSREINNLKHVAKTINKQRKKLEKERDKLLLLLSPMRDRFRSIEKDSTCYGCQESCPVKRDIFNLRCEMYNDLPF